MNNLKRKSRAIICFLLAFLMLFSLSFTACDSSSNHDENHLCESVCENCGKCTDDSCNESACKDKCECEASLFTVTLSATNACVKLDENSQFGKLKQGTVVTFTAKELDGYTNLSVSLNGTTLTETNGKYSFTVNSNCVLQVAAEPYKGEQTITLSDATIEVLQEKIYYVIKGTCQNYTLKEIKDLYFDLQNYGSFEGGIYSHWNRNVFDNFDATLNGEEFSVYMDISSYPANTCWIPHFISSESDGDVKVYTSIGETIVYNNKRYTVVDSPYSIACVMIKPLTEATKNPSDVTPPEINEVKNYEYFKSTEIPRIDINITDGLGSIDDERRIKGYKGFHDDVPEYDYAKANISVSNCEGYNIDAVSGKVKVRGNYSSMYPKKPLRIKFDKKQAMCGLNGGQKFKNWVLLNDYKDSSMLRNSVALYLGNSILESDGYYASDFRYVEVYLNGAYNGLYLLCEQQEVKEGRIDLPEATEPVANDPETVDAGGVNIGYLLEYDGYYFNEDPLECFTIDYDRLQYENGAYFTPTQKGFTIKSDVYTEAQRDFAKKCLQNIWEIVYDATYHSHSDLSKNPYYTLNSNGDMVVDTTIKTPREAVEKVIDVNSLVGVYILNEICEDNDISWSSFYMTLDMSDSGNKKLTFTAPWDFDSALGNLIGKNDTLFAINSTRDNGNSASGNPWLAVLANEGWFWTHVQAKWRALRLAGTFDGVISMIDYCSATYVTYYAKNFEKWSWCMGNKIEGGQQDIITTFTTQKDAAAYLKNWLSVRITNLDKLIDDRVALLLS